VVSTRAKQRLFFGVLVALIVWGFVHYGLVRRYGINHWRFAGFAMYTRPTPVPYLQFSGTLPDGPLTPARLRAALGEESTRVDDFIEARKLWGQLHPPDELARLIFRRLPELHELTITIFTVGLEPGDDYLSYTVDRREFGRSP
jgi:hypothetical protein